MHRRIVLFALLLLSSITVAPAWAQAPDRTRVPEPGPAPTLQIPPIDKRVLSNGLPVWIVEMHEVPVVNLSLIVKSGAAADPAGKFGIAHLTAAMLDEGAGTRTALELADAIDFLGASLATTSTFDASLVQLHSLVSTFDEALPLFADVALRPTFAANELDRLRSERLTTLLQVRDNPAQLASAAYARLLFGPTHRYGTAVMGTETTNKALAVDDVKAFYSAHYGPQNAHVLVVGDVTAADVLPKLEKALGSWKASVQPARPTLPSTPAPVRHIYLIDKPGAPQSQVRVAGIGVPRTSPDFFVLEVMNTILGGSFTSRLNQNLREEHGYSYGAGSGFAMRRESGPFIAQAGVQTDKTAESLVEFFKELDGMHQPVPGDELARARNLQALGFPGSFETASQMAGHLADLVIYGLPETFFNEYVPKIQAVTAADVLRAAKQYLDTNRLIVAIAGDLATIEKPVRNTDIAPVTIVPAADVLK